MMTEIGVVAGEILEMLNTSRRLLTFAEVEIFIDRPFNIVYMALGWLIREHYVRVIEMGGQKFLLLVDQETLLPRDSHAVLEHLN